MHLFLDQLEDRRLLAAPVLPLVSWPPASAATGGQTSPAASSSASSAILNLVVPAGFSATPGGAGYNPAQIRQAYGFNLLSGLSGKQYNNAGQGETIAIVDAFADPAISHDVQQFDEQFNIGGAAGNPPSTGFLTVVNKYGGSPQNVTGPGYSGWDAETSIDVEWAHAIAPGANILLLEAATNNMADLDAAVQYAASQPNVCVVSMSYGLNSEFANEYVYDSLYSTPVGHQGVAFVAASGDYGANQSYQQASPNLIVVGGTTLPADQNGNPVRFQEVGWSLGSDPFNTALASGGGISQYEAQPPYQQGIVTQSTIYKTGPDVAFDADPATGVSVYDSLSTPTGLPWGEYGGTSISSPMWAGLIAIADQARAARGEPSLDSATQLLPALYQISQADSHAFHDITQGYNGYSAGPGYDLVTGLGTPNAQNLIPDLVKIDSTPAAPVTVYWTGDAGDNNWDDPGNWSTVDPARRNVPQSVLPGPNDKVVIDIAGAPVNHAIARYDTIRTLEVTAPGVTLNLDSGTLDLSGSGNLGTFQAESPGDVVTLMGGVLKSARVTPSTTITVPPSAPGILDGGVLNGTLQALEASTLELQGNWINNGTITAGTGSTLILGDYWSAAASDAGARSEAWVNQGTIAAASATVELGGWLTSTAGNLGSLALGSDTVELIGTLDNRHETLALAPGQISSPGSWILSGGRIDGGTITTSGGAALIAPGGAPFTPPANGTLDGVTLNGTLDMSASGAYVVVVDGLTLNTDLYLSGDNTELQFNDGSTVAAGPLVQSATIHLQGAYSVLYNNTSSNSVLNNDPSQTVTIGRQVTISGESASSGVFGPLDNLGTIEKSSAGQLLVDELVNDGSVQAGGLYAVTLDSQATVSEGYYGFYFSPGQPWSNNADGTITAPYGSDLWLSGTWTNNGTITATVAYLVLRGTWTNNGTITANGVYLSLWDTWTNNGTITVYNYSYGPSWVDLGNVSPALSGPSDIWKNPGVLSIAAGANLNLGDYFTTDEFESGFQDRGVHLDLAQYTVYLSGTMDNSPADNPITGGILRLDASTGPLYFYGGQIDGGTITGTAPIVESGTLNGVVVDTAVNVSNAVLTLQGNWNITVNGSITATGYAGLNLSGTWTNNGSITATGSSVDLGGTWTNNGSITADAASTVTLGDPSNLVSGPGDIWKSPGMLSIAAGAWVSLGGYFTTDEFQSGFQQLGAHLNLSQYTVSLIGILDNSAADNPITGGTLALNASTGPLYFGGLTYYFPTTSGVIEHGTITTSGTDDLVANSGTLDGVTLDGTLDMSGQFGYTQVNIMDGLTLNTDLDLSGNNAYLNFLDGSTLAVGSLVTSATIHLSGNNADLNNGSYPSQTVTIGRGITISGESPYSSVSGPIDNLGSIQASNGSMLFSGLVNNDGSIQASNGGSMSFSGLVNNDGSIQASNGGSMSFSGLVNDGTIQASNGGVVTIESEELNYNNPVTDVPWINDADGTITATSGAMLNLYDNWTNQGTITVDSSSTVSLGSAVSDSEYAATADFIWTNSGTLSIAKGATIYLGDYFTTDDFANHFQQFGVHLDLSKYTVNLIGTIDNNPADNPITGGTLALNHSTGPLYLYGGTIDQGTITTRGSDDLVVTDGYYNYFGGVTLNGVTLDGTLDMSEPDAVVSVSNGLTLNTDLNLSGAGASLQFNDSTGSTLAGGATVHLSGDSSGISNYGIQTVIIGPGITLSGENANSSISGAIDNLGTVVQQSAGQMTVTGLVNGGTVTVASGGTVTEQGLFANGGTVTIAAGGTFSTSGADYTQSGGTTTVDGILSAANVNLIGGLLTGSGTIQADVTNSATVEPGGTVGTLTIQGNYTQTAAGVLLIQIAGASQYGQLAVIGTATLGGTLDVSLIDGYTPALGASFSILTFNQRSGDFATENGLKIGHHRSFVPSYQNGALVLTVRRS